jgi:ferredoxin-NADP reductase
VYSRPVANDQVGADFDARGYINTALPEKIGVSQGSDFYMCGPTSFLGNMRDGLRSLGGALRKCAHGNLRCSRVYYPWYGAG